MEKHVKFASIHNLLALTLLFQISFGLQGSHDQTLAARTCVATFLGVGNSSTLPLNESALRTQLHNGKADVIRVSVLLPTYREFKNGHIFRLLEDFTNQSVYKTNFDLVFVVNNTKEIAAAKEAVYEENQDTIKLLNFAARVTDTPPVFFAKLPEWQRKTIYKVRSSGLQVKVHDLSTKGIERNMGLIRDQGCQFIAERYPPAKGKRVVAMLDVDTHVPKDYIENAICHFALSPIEALVVGMRTKIEPRAEKWIYQTAFAQRYVTYGQRAIRLLRKHDLYGGPQSLASLEAIQRIGGVPRVASGEDWYLSSLLARSGKTKHALDTVVVTADRARSDGWDAKLRLDHRDTLLDFANTNGNTDLRLLAWRIHDEFLKQGSQVNTPTIEKLFDYFGIPFNQIQWKSTDFNLFLVNAAEVKLASFLKQFPSAPTERIREVLTPFGLQENQLDLIKVRTMAENPLNPVLPWSAYMEFGTLLKRNYPGKRVENRIPIGDEGILKLLEKHVGKSELQFFDERIAIEKAKHVLMLPALRAALVEKLSAIRDGKKTISQFDNPDVKEFLEDNIWIDSLLTQYHNVGKRESWILNSLATDFPDWFKPFEETPFKLFSAQAMALHDFLSEARNHPEQYPRLTKFLGVINGSP